MADPRNQATLQAGPPRTAWIIIGVGGCLLVGTLLLPWRSALQARAALTAIGVVDLLGAWLRPAAMWNAGSTRLWRDTLGDELTVWLAAAIGLAMVVFAWAARIGQ